MPTNRVKPQAATKLVGFSSEARYSPPYREVNPKMVERVEMAFGKRREDDLHKMSLGLARGAPRLDAFKDRVGRHAFAGVGQVFPVAGNNFLVEPALDRGVAIEQGAHAIAQDFADRGIGAGFDLALDGFGHVERQGDAELLGGPHGSDDNIQ
jgi:hypothetical protein